MDCFGWIVLGVFLFCGVYLLYAVEKEKSWALRYVRTLASIDPEARRFHEHSASLRTLTEEEDTIHDRHKNEPWWIYL